MSAPAWCLLHPRFTHPEVAHAPSTLPCEGGWEWTGIRLFYSYKTHMTETGLTADLPSEPLRPDAQSLDLTPLAPGFRNVLRIQIILTWVPLLIGAMILATAFDAFPWRGVMLAALACLAAFTVIFLPQRRYRRWGYQLTADQLRVVRGYWFHVDTIVPFVRVQHIDVSQGPVERLCGVATLTVHTAGTHNSVVELPGLPPQDADAMRDAIRAHIRSDAE